MKSHPILRVLKADPRYKLEAYEFVREALSYAQEQKGTGEESLTEESAERHLTGQQLCEASREYALEQFGMLAKVVLNSWGIRTTDDLGQVVYNMIDAKLMKKSPTDRQEDFNNVFDFETAFENEFEITVTDPL